jgi:hypothetical protein
MLNRQRFFSCIRGADRLPILAAQELDFYLSESFSLKKVGPDLRADPQLID